ncbi:unnamed protein product [Malus baccata var. baccata]
MGFPLCCLVWYGEIFRKIRLVKQYGVGKWAQIVEKLVGRAGIEFFLDEMLLLNFLPVLSKRKLQKMKIDPIGSLSAFEFNKKIRVRVCGIWRPKVIGKDNTFGGLQCILVDEMVRILETEITEEIDEQNISDTEDFPIKSLKNKVSPSKSEIVFTASKTRYFDYLL